MKWLDSARTRLRLLLRRRSAESRMDDEFRLHIEMEADQLMRTRGLAPDEARRQALAAFGGVEKHKEALRDGRGLAWLGGLWLDVKLGGRMLRKYPGLTLAGGLALALAIGIGAAWYDLSGKMNSPTIPLPDGDRLVVIETQNALTNEPELRVVRDFLEWRRELRTIEELGAYRTSTRNLLVDNAAPAPIRLAEITAAAFGAARVSPLFGRGLLDADDEPAAPGVMVLGYDMWQRRFGGRQDVVGTVVRLGTTPTTVVGVMPKGFGYPLNYVAWTPLPLRASYEPLEGDAVSVIGRLAPGMTREQADAELRGPGERAAAAFPATHQHLRPRVLHLGEVPDAPDAALLAARNLAVLPVLAIACMSVGTLIYARTATRQEEIAVRSALGASRARIVGQLFVEALVLASAAAAVGLVGADRIVTLAIETLNQASGGMPFWATPGVRVSTILYAGGLAAVAAVMLSLLPALRATRARVQPHLASRSATLRFGRVWTGAMIVQLAVTAIGIPAALETANEARRNAAIRAAFPSGEYLAAHVDVSRTSDDETAPAVEARLAPAFAALQQRLAQEPGVVAVTFSDRVPGKGARIGQADVVVALPSGARFRTSPVDAGFFEVLGRPMVAGRAFHEGDRRPDARTVIVNEAFARVFGREAGGGSPVGAHLRHAEPSPQPDASATGRSAAGDMTGGASFEIVGVVRDIGLDPDDLGNEQPFVFRAASAGAVSPLVLTVRMRSNPAILAARLPVVAADVDAHLLVNESRGLADWLQDTHMQDAAAAQAAVAGLGLFLSAMSIFSLVSVNVSRRTREIGLRVALGAHPRQVLAGIVSRAVLLVGSGTTAGGILLLVFVAKNWSTEDTAAYAWYLAVTSAIMLAACLLACIVPARRALGINPSEALKDA